MLQLALAVTSQKSEKFKVSTVTSLALAKNDIVSARLISSCLLGFMLRSLTSDNQHSRNFLTWWSFIHTGSLDMPISLQQALKGVFHCAENWQSPSRFFS